MKCNLGSGEKYISDGGSGSRCDGVGCATDNAQHSVRYCSYHVNGTFIVCVLCISATILFCFYSLHFFVRPKNRWVWREKRGNVSPPQ